MLERFLSEATALSDKLGCLLVQLPPSLGCNLATAERFLTDLRARYAGAVALEPRHVSWFTPDAERLLLQYRVARVAADPALIPAAAELAGGPQTVYFRLHGSPKIYYSAYSEAYLDALALRLQAAAQEAEQVWCVFDNTAEGEATVTIRSINSQSDSCNARQRHRQQHHLSSLSSRSR